MSKEQAGEHNGSRLLGAIFVTMHLGVVAAPSSRPTSLPPLAGALGQEKRQDRASYEHLAGDPHASPSDGTPALS